MAVEVGLVCFVDEGVRVRERFCMMLISVPYAVCFFQGSGSYEKVPTRLRIDTAEASLKFPVVIISSFALSCLRFVACAKLSYLGPRCVKWLLNSP